MSYLHVRHMLDDFWQILGTNFQRKLVCNTFLSLPLNNGLILKTFCVRNNGGGILGLHEVAIAWLVGSHVYGSVVSHVGWWYGNESGEVVCVKG